MPKSHLYKRSSRWDYGTLNLSEKTRLTMKKELNIEEVLKEIDEDLSYFTKEIEELEELLKDPSLNWAFLHILKTFLISLL